jgi:hypothetical protein
MILTLSLQHFLSKIREKAKNLGRSAIAFVHNYSKSLPFEEGVLSQP